MGRNKRHKKQLRSEKAKIKLKDNKTKFLPKGQNVTDASFKIKPIVLPEQLKTYDNGVILKQRLVPIKILLDKLDHHNRSYKEEACDLLKQVIETNENVNVEYLPDLLKRLCPLILHEEPSVRKKSLKTLDALLCKARSSSATSLLTPFHPILISFLRTALTHIKRPIREDSLLYLDVLLRHVPRMLAQHSAVLLPTFLSLVSKHNSGGGGGPSISKLARLIGVADGQQVQVSVDLGSTMTSAKWRVKVLGRLWGLLEAIGGICEDGEEDFGSSIVGAPILNITDSKLFPLIVDHFSDTSENLYNYTADDGNNITTVTNNMQNILSILCDIWAEVAPEKNNFLKISTDTILSFETAEHLSGILKIVFLLWDKILNKSDFSTLFTNTTDKFLNGLLTLFPFHKRVASQKNQKILDGHSGNDQRCTQDNLIICYIFAVMNPKLGKQDKIEFGRKVANYLNACLRNSNVITQSNITYLTKCLSVIFTENAKNWHKGNSVNMEELLRNTINFQITSTFNQELFNVLCDLTQEKSLRSLPAFETFLNHVPSLLCKQEISAYTLDKIHWISLQKIHFFYTCLLECLPEILKNLHKIKIIDSPNRLLNQRLQILYMFENCPEINKLEKEYFMTFVQDFCEEENEYTYYVKNFILKNQS